MVSVIVPVSGWPAAGFWAITVPLGCVVSTVSVVCTWIDDGSESCASSIDLPTRFGATGGTALLGVSGTCGCVVPGGGAIVPGRAAGAGPAVASPDRVVSQTISPARTTTASTVTVTALPRFFFVGTGPPGGRSNMAGASKVDGPGLGCGFGLGG